MVKAEPFSSYPELVRVFILSGFRLLVLGAVLAVDSDRSWLPVPFSVVSSVDSDSSFSVVSSVDSDSSFSVVSSVDSDSSFSVVLLSGFRLLVLGMPFSAVDSTPRSRCRSRWIPTPSFSVVLGGFRLIVLGGWGFLSGFRLLVFGAVLAVDCGSSFSVPFSVDSGSSFSVVSSVDSDSSFPVGVQWIATHRSRWLPLGGFRLLVLGAVLGIPAHRSRCRSRWIPTPCAVSVGFLSGFRLFVAVLGARIGFQITFV